MNFSFQLSKQFYFIFLILISIVLYLFLTTNKAQGNDKNIFLERGSRYKVCQTIKKELENIAIDEKRFCDLAILLEAPTFTPIKWSSLNISNNLPIAREIFLRYNLRTNFLDKEKRDNFWKKNKNYFETQVNQGLFQIEKARFDLDYDKQLEDVYRLATYPCKGIPQNFNHWYWSYHVLKNKNSSLSQQTLSQQILGYTLSPFDALIFDGRTYLFSYNPADNFIGVYEPQSVRHGYDLAMIMICEFKVKGA